MPDGVMDIQIIRPVSDDQIKKQVAYALSLGLPEVQRGPVTHDRLYIYANGPSAATAPINQPAMALNGAIALCKDQPAAWWVACDPQPLVKNFLSHGYAGKYLLASRCHPDAFLRASGHGEEIELWHIADAGAELLTDEPLMPDAPSVTLSALFLAYFMGYRNITVYGWDGCYIDGKHHAIDQAHDAETMTAELDGKEFVTTLAWLAEAEDAAKAMNMLPDLNLTIEGPGMIATAMKPFIEHRERQQAFHGPSLVDKMSEVAELRRSVEEGEGICPKVPVEQR